MNLNYLVVDGTIINGADSTIIRISRTQLLDQNPATKGERNATVTLEDADNNTLYYLLQLNEQGEYATAGINLDQSKTYHLRINTANGSQYISADMDVKQSPPIDSISWKPTSEGITIYANTHGRPDLNSKGYYLWNFIETWEYTSRYYSSLLLENGVVIYRPADKDISHCWKTVPSTIITVGSTQKLSSDVMREFPLIAVPKASYQLSRTYSILVRQRSLTEEGYAYWQQLQKTTQNVGGLFDPLPAQVTGNFTCLTDPSEPVLGFFSGSTIDEKRIFIRVRDLPRSLQLSAPYPYCSIDSLPIASVEGSHANLYLIDSYGLAAPVGYLSTSRECVDCTVQGGVTTKPDFWEE